MDFSKLELETWDSDGEDIGAALAQSSGGIFGSSRHSITADAPFLDYSSFLAYAAKYEIEMIPISDLRKGVKVGSGATMAVFKGTCPSRWENTEVALKRLNLELPRTESAMIPNSIELYQLLAAASLEVRVLSDSLLRFHPNIVDLLAVSWEELSQDEGDRKHDRSGGSVRPILIVELAYSQYPTLQSFYEYSISRGELIGMDTKVSILSDIADALSSVHTCGVIHGDIKPQNILIFRKGPMEPVIAKLSDFGGCQPPTDSTENPSEYLSRFAVLGTEYWNSPEVYLNGGEGPNPQSRLSTRDYYSMGLLAYYVLFEDMPFGDDQDNADANLERISKIKQDPQALINLVNITMSSRWRLAGEKSALKQMREETRFYDRWEIYQKICNEGKAREVFRGDDDWTILDIQERRQYSLYFIMLQFLQIDPEARQKYDLMRDLRVFLSDKAISRTLKDVYLMQGMGLFWSAYQKDVFGLWEIRRILDGSSYGEEVIMLGKNMYKPGQIWTWVSANQDNAIHTDTFSFDHVTNMPPSLRGAFLQELSKRAIDPKEPRRIANLLSLEFCKSLGYGVENDNTSVDFALEAARLGSMVGKRIVLHRSKLQGKLPPVDRAERHEWIFECLLTSMPSKSAFVEKILNGFQDNMVAAKVLSKLFEEECSKVKHIKKIFKVEGGDPDIQKLFSAAISGQVIRLKSLLGEKYKNALATKLNGFNLLHAASEYGQLGVVRLLVQDYGMDPNEVNTDGISAVNLAARVDNMKAVVDLLDFKADYRSVLSIRTLRCLANYGGTRSIRTLNSFAKLPSRYPTLVEPFPLKAYLDGDLTTLPETEKDDDEPDFPPIFASILGDNIGTLWYLLEMGCSRDIHTQFISGFLAPIHVAANLRPIHLALLLHYGACPNQRTKDKNQWTALHIACTAHSIPKYNYPRVEVEDLLPLDSPSRGLLGLRPGDYFDAKMLTIQLLHKVYGAEINAQDWVGRTALAHLMADRHDALTVARYLIEECSADIRIKDFRGLSCLHRAVWDRAQSEYLEFCIEKGVDINETDIYKLTPLMAAVASGNAEISRLLVSLGADLLATQHRGWTCLHLAVIDGHMDIFDYLYLTAEERRLLPAVVAIEDMHRQNLLHKIIQNGPTSYLRRFPREAISGVLDKLDIVGFTLLHHAVLNESVEATEFLLQQGCHSSTKGWKQLTALHIAYASRNQKIIQVLKCWGSTDERSCDAEGRNPEAYAELAAADPGFFMSMVSSYWEDRDNLAGPMNVSESELEDENRQKGAPSGGWLAFDPL